MNVYVVIKYNTFFDGEEVGGIFLDKEKAKQYCKDINYFRIEKHKIIDSDKEASNES